MRLYVERAREVALQCIVATIVLYPLWRWDAIPVSLSGFAVGVLLMLGNFLRWRRE